MNAYIFNEMFLKIKYVTALKHSSSRALIPGPTGQLVMMLLDKPRIPTRKKKIAK